MAEKLQATRAFTYAGKALVPGDVFDASTRDVRVLTAIGRARRAVIQPAYVAPVIIPEVDNAEEPEVAAEDAPKKRRGRPRKEA